MSNNPTSAHNTKAVLTRLNTLNDKAKKQLYDLLALIVAKKTGNDIKTLLVVNDNGQERYAGNSIDIATTVYLSTLDRAIKATQQGKAIKIEFYAIDQNSIKKDLGGVQS